MEGKHICPRCKSSEIKPSHKFCKICGLKLDLGSHTVTQSEHYGVDHFGGELVIGDDIAEDPNTGALVCQQDLQRYLTETYGFKFYTAK